MKTVATLLISLVFIAGCQKNSAKDDLMPVPGAEKASPTHDQKNNEDIAQPAHAQSGLLPVPGTSQKNKSLTPLDIHQKKDK